jgi:hypothetical protein
MGPVRAGLDRRGEKPQQGTSRAHRSDGGELLVIAVEPSSGRAPAVRITPGPTAASRSPMGLANQGTCSMSAGWADLMGARWKARSKSPLPLPVGALVLA